MRCDVNSYFFLLLLLLLCVLSPWTTTHLSLIYITFTQLIFQFVMEGRKYKMHTRTYWNITSIFTQLTIIVMIAMARIRQRSEASTKNNKNTTCTPSSNHILNTHIRSWWRAFYRAVVKITLNEFDDWWYNFPGPELGSLEIGSLVHFCSSNQIPFW